MVTLIANETSIAFPEESLKLAVFTLYNKRYASLAEFMENYTEKEVNSIVYFLFNRDKMEGVEFSFE